MLKIKILGTRGEIEESCRLHSKYSGVLVDNTLLFDVGEKAFLKTQPKAIFLTHLHPDHAYFVRKGKEEQPSTAAPIFAPEAPKGLPIQILNEPIEWEGYSITPLPTHHSLHVKSQGYLIKKGNRSVLYTGDLVWMDKKYTDLLGIVDLVITEASFLRKGGMIRKDLTTGLLYGHNGVPNLMDLFKRHTHKILFTHFGAWFYASTRTSRQKLQTLGKEKDLQVIVAHDGLEIVLN